MDIETVDPLAAWDWPVEPVANLIQDSGLINETWAVSVDGRPVAVLQQLNTRIFRPEVHLDIEAITAHLAARGRVTPRLLTTRAGGLWHEDPHGGVWRCLTWVGETTWNALPSARHAESAGRLVGRFHAALFDLRHTFAFERPGAHDTRAHITKLQQVLVSHRNHALRRRVGPIADEILELWTIWDGPTDLPARLCHGDLKVSNVRFSGDQAVSLIDLDTFQWGTLDAELGDALRSWCNPTTEDDPSPVFDLDLFEASMRGYADGTRGLPLTRAEWRSIVPGVERICIELASRFARDALEESYFGWSATYARPGEHHLARARAMTDLALLVNESADEAEMRLERARREAGEG